MNNSRLTQILTEWPQWGIVHKPALVKGLEQGVRNQSYLLSTNKQQYVLRINTADTTYSTNRTLEFTIQNAVAQLGLSPRIVHQNTEQQYWLSEYIEGETLNSSNTFNHTEIKALCKTINSYQQIPLSILPYSYTKQLNLYREQIVASGNWSVQKQQCHDIKINICKTFEQEYANTPRVLCHHDLNPNNIVRTKSLPQFIILDWEFAVKGIASMDYGILTVELGINSQQLALLSGYSAQEITVAASIYAYTCELYNQLA